MYCRYDYYCVIYGWDYTCEMTEDWIHQMGVNQLPLGPNQPFYNVLVNDGTNRYAAQGINVLYLVFLKNGSEIMLIFVTFSDTY